MFSTDFIFRQQENLVDNQKCQAGLRPLCNKIPFPSIYSTNFSQLEQLIKNIFAYTILDITHKPIKLASIDETKISTNNL